MPLKLKNMWLARNQKSEFHFCIQSNNAFISLKSNLKISIWLIIQIKRMELFWDKFAKIKLDSLRTSEPKINLISTIQDLFGTFSSNNFTECFKKYFYV